MDKQGFNTDQSRTAFYQRKSKIQDRLRKIEVLKTEVRDMRAAQRRLVEKSGTFLPNWEDFV